MDGGAGTIDELDALFAALAEDRPPAPARASPEVVAMRKGGSPARQDVRAMVTEQAAADPERLPWPDRWFTETDSGEVAALRRFWALVLIHILRDVVRGWQALSPAQRAVRPIPYIGSPDFQTVCHFAGVDPDAMSGAVRARIDDPAFAAGLVLYNNSRAVA